MSLFPEAGSLVPEYEELGLRQIFVESYRLIYRIHDEELTILTVVHAARNLPDTFHP